MKKLKWILLALVVLVVIGVVITVIYLDTIVKSVVQSQASSSLGVETTLGEAKISLLGGTVALNDLQISSPKGFAAPKIFTLGGVKVGISPTKLTEKPLKVDLITIDKPVLVIEQKDMKLNVNALMDGMPKSDAPVTTSDGKTSEPIKLIINTLELKDTSVSIRSGFSPDITIPIPSMTLKDIGTGEGNKNGAAIKDVINIILTKTVSTAADSDKLPEPVRQLLKGGLGDMAKNATDLAKKELEKGVGNLLGGDKKDGKAGDAGKAAGDALNNILGGNKEKK